MLSLLYIFHRAFAMSCARNRYVLHCSLLMALYVLLVVAISWVVDLSALPYPLRVIAAVSPGLPLLGVLWVFDRYLRELPDEFLRFLMSRAALLAGGLVVGALSAWGFLEQYAGWPRFPLVMAFPAFWMAYSLTSALMCRRYR